MRSWVPNRERRMDRLKVRFWLVSAASLARGSHSIKNLPRIFHKCTIVLLHTKRMPRNHTIHVSPKPKKRFVFHQLSKSVITLKITSLSAVSLCALCTVIYIIAGRCPWKRWGLSQACQESPARDKISSCTQNPRSQILCRGKKHPTLDPWFPGVKVQNICPVACGIVGASQCRRVSKYYTSE